MRENEGNTTTTLFPTKAWGKAPHVARPPQFIGSTVESDLRHEEKSEPGLPYQPNPDPAPEPFNPDVPVNP